MQMVQRHAMAGLLPVRDLLSPTRKLHLGYRHLYRAKTGPFPGRYTAHEFHYATTLKRRWRHRSFPATDDAEGTALPAMGLSRRDACMRLFCAYH